MRHKIFIAALLLYLGFAPLYAGQQPVTLSEIKKSLACQCDCNMTVEACQGSMACKSADNLAQEAEKYIQQGMSKADILAAFTKKYGEHILAAPTKKGFNLTAWLLPFAAILLAGFAIVMLLKRWVRQQQNSGDLAMPNIPGGAEKKSPYEEKLDEALRFLD